MVKRKLDGALDESSADQKFVNGTRLYITCENSGGLHLAEPGLMAGRLAGRLAGWLAGWPMKFERGLKF